MILKLRCKIMQKSKIHDESRQRKSCNYRFNFILQSAHINNQKDRHGDQISSENNHSPQRLAIGLCGLTMHQGKLTMHRGKLTYQIRTGRRSLDCFSSTSCVCFHPTDQPGRRWQSRMWGKQRLVPITRTFRPCGQSNNCTRLERKNK